MGVISCYLLQGAAEKPQRGEPRAKLAQTLLTVLSRPIKYVKRGSEGFKFPLSSDFEVCKQSSIMHHALRISEVLSVIFEFIRHYDDQVYRGPRVGARTLASLARTCYLFSSPALDTLWQELHSFDPLLKVFPIVSRSSQNPADLR